MWRLLFSPEMKLSFLEKKKLSFKFDLLFLGCLIPKHCLVIAHFSVVHTVCARIKGAVCIHLSKVKYVKHTCIIQSHSDVVRFMLMYQLLVLLASYKY